MKIALWLWLAAATPALADPACRLDHQAAPDVAWTFAGIVRGPATAQEIQSQTAIAINRTHAALSPKYESLPRVFVLYEDGGRRHGTIAAVIDGDIPPPGAPVTLASRRRDPEAPCAFIPWTIVKGPPGKPVS
ncbi:MAG: hypothetical protein KGM15_09980 [Pseudomonadota bacterium]|nr:hypothetical protein [Pseudomonadota bacterium]